MPRLLVALATLCACGAVAAAFKTCSPTFDPADVLNLFYANKGEFAWEYLPDLQYPLTPQGGSLEMSETNTPENGAFWIMASTAEDGTTIANLSLASQEPGIQCVRSVGRNRPATTGPCDLTKSQFTMACGLCPPSTTPDPSSPAASEPSSPSSTRPTGTRLARMCTFESIASPGQCLTSVPQKDAALPRLELRPCRSVRSPGQTWDVRLA